jgi:hypothetical protein
MGGAVGVPVAGLAWAVVAHWLAVVGGRWA